MERELGVTVGHRWSSHPESVSFWEMLEQGVIPVHVGMESPWERAIALLGALWLRADTGDQKSEIIIFIGSFRE